MTRSHILAGITLLLSTLTAMSQTTRIYIANDDHTDYMWTADTDTYARTFVNLIDFHLNLAEETKNDPPPFRARFNADGCYWLAEYERLKSPAEFNALIAKVKDGTISAPLNTLVSCYGAQPLEAVLRGLYYAGRLERRYHFRFSLATAMENQTLPLGLASLFAGSGATYSWRGVCGCASKLPNSELARRDREIYWYTGLDGQRLLMKWYSLGNHNIGGYWEAGNPTTSITSMEANTDFLHRYADPATGEPYKIFGLFGFGGDDLERKTGVQPPPKLDAVPWLQGVPSSAFCDHFHIHARQLTTPHRQVIVSNEVDFFHDFEQHYGKTLDSHTVTYGNEWDLFSASMSETSARVKRAVEKLRTAELLATLVSLHYPDFMRLHTGARDRAFHALGLYWEHNWTADGPISRGQRAAWQQLIASQIEAYIDGIHQESLIRLGGMIPRPDNANRFFVLNPLGWPRSEHADFPYTGPANVRVRDLTTLADVPSQIITFSGQRFLRILASDVPPAGYKVFEILPASPDAPANLPPAATTTLLPDGSFLLENSRLSLTVAKDGALLSFIDKSSPTRQLAATVNGSRLNDIAPLTDDGEPLRVENIGPVSVSLRARSASGLDHSSLYTLYLHSPRVDIANEIHQNFADLRYWAFSFNLDRPTVHTEEVGAILLIKRKSDGGHYADRLARYDHISVNHFADLTDGSGTFGITLSNPDLSFARLGNSTPTTLDTTTPQINFLAGGQVDGAWLGIPNQNGNRHFLQRFALRPHSGYDPTSAMKFALEHQNPLVCAPIIYESKLPPHSPYPQTTYSLLSTSDPNILLWAVKPAEEGIDHGVIVRLWNTSDSPATTSLTFHPGASHLTQTTHIETDLTPPSQLHPNTSINLTFARQQLQTYRLLPASPAPSPAPSPKPGP